MELIANNLKKSLNSSLSVSETMIGCNDPNFKRIHHNYHHIVLYVKDYIMKERCKNYFEIGTHFGHSLCSILQSKYRSKIVSCDRFCVGDGIAPDCRVEDVEQLANDNMKKFNIHGYDCKIFRGNSHSNEMHLKVKDEFLDGIDLLFIDGDHSYNGVTLDFEKYFGLVNSGGYIIFDDYLPLMIGDKHRECPIAVNHLVDKYRDQLEVTGLVNDNIDFIVVKK